jgi:hypothetical protein
LLGKHIKEDRYRSTHAIFQGDRIEFFSAKVSGEKNFPAPLDDLNRGLLGGNQFVVNMGIAFRVVAAFDNFIGLFRQQLSESGPGLGVYFTCILFFPMFIIHSDPISL